ncbi:MAG TPA: metallophosphoesterase family protein [Planctomycetota bacterium]|nr:metallophosphoesterase family protein [Planctomycetota bacterium]
MRSVLWLGLLCACVQPDSVPRHRPAWEPFDPTQPGWQASCKMLLVADCQVHNLLSAPVPERNLTIEAASGTAIRPPQLDLFATDVLSYVLQRHAADVEFIVHLGDALDLACEGELDKFLQVMTAAGRPWVMAPGNHDFYYFGSYDPDDPELWAAACRGAGGRLTKGDFIRRYVAALAQQPVFAPLAAALAIDTTAATADGRAVARTLPPDFEWQASARDSRLQRICWHIDATQPWRSFLLQLVTATGPGEDGLPAYVLLLDSCQYGHRPALIPNAWCSYPVGLNCGFTGEMLPDQLRTARAWLEAVPRPSARVAMCHHPFRSLAPRSRACLGWLWREMKLGLLVTAHTHKGFYAHHDLGGGQDELELNLGSTTDWPMEWRTLQAYANFASQRIYARSERHTLVEALRQDGDAFLPGWEVPPGAPDDYRGYRQGSSAQGLLFDFYLAHHLVPYWLPMPTIRANAAARHTEQQIKVGMLWTWQRLLQQFPTDPRHAAAWPAGCVDDEAVLARIVAALAQPERVDERVDLLAELAEFERTRRSCNAAGEATDAARGRYKLSQAAWAARYESAQGRLLQVEDELIRVDWPVDQPPSR